MTLLSVALVFTFQFRGLGRSFPSFASRSCHLLHIILVSKWHDAQPPDIQSSVPISSQFVRFWGGVLGGAERQSLLLLVATDQHRSDGKRD